MADRSGGIYLLSKVDEHKNSSILLSIIKVQLLAHIEVRITKYILLKLDNSEMLRLKYFTPNIVIGLQ